MLVAIHISGVNFLDVYFRSGLYKSDRPIAIGSEAAGVIAAVGEGVTGLQAGDRVAYTMVRGTYARVRGRARGQPRQDPRGAVARNRRRGAAAGRDRALPYASTFPLNDSHTCLIHAAAGGAGGLVVQMAKAAGATVIGTVGTAEKAREILALGADHAIVYTEQDFEAEVKRLTDGAGVHVVYDSVGRTTFDKSLKVLQAPRHARAVRPVERAGRPGRSADAQCRVAVSDPSQPRPLHHAARRAPLARQ